jgi:hypothetical protein
MTALSWVLIGATALVWIAMVGAVAYHARR